MSQELVELAIQNEKIYRLSGEIFRRVFSTNLANLVHAQGKKLDISVLCSEFRALWAQKLPQVKIPEKDEELYEEVVRPFVIRLIGNGV